MRRTFLTLMLVGLLACWVVGCKSEAEPEAAATSAPAQVVTKAAPAQEPTKAAAASPTATPQVQYPATVADEEMLYDDIRDLQDLKSYRSKSETSWTEEGGDPETVTIEIAYTTDPPAQHLIMSGLSDAGQAEDDTLEMIRIGQDSYTRYGEEWITMQLADDEMLPDATVAYQPENLLRSSKGKYKGIDRVNGVEAKHYVFDQEELAKSPVFVNVIEASGEVWVSTEHNVAVRSIVHFKGKDADTDKIVTLDVETDITDINADILIEPPEGVEQARTAADIPIMPGATEKVVMAPMTSYKVAATTEAVEKFYAEEMPKNGWKAEEAVIAGFLNYTKGDRTVQIVIQAQDGQTAVVVVEE